MMTELDEGKGLVKTSWAKVRKRVAQVNPEFAKIVDEISPEGDDYAVYLAYHRFGDITGDTESLFLPQLNGKCYKLSDPNTPKQVLKHLLYGQYSLPLGMVLEKEREMFLDLKGENTILPWIIFRPGDLFPLSMILNQKGERVYAPNGFLSASSGARSVFMLPNIGCASNYINLRREFNVPNEPPKSLHEHWYLFKEILRSPGAQCNWRSCVIYFSEQWIEHIHKDKGWDKLKTYLHGKAWRFYAYQRNRIYYDIAFSIFQRKHNLKPNPYLADTARQLFAIMLGEAVAYAPACNDNALPLSLLQYIFTEVYGLKKYFPTIMHPAHFSFKHPQSPVYYSLQHPSMLVFSPKSREVSSTLFEIRELEYIMRIFVKEFSQETGICNDTFLRYVALNIDISYFHNVIDPLHIVKLSTEMKLWDKRFSSTNINRTMPGAQFASNSSFVRGCLSIKAKADLTPCLP